MTEWASKPPVRIQILNIINDFKKINELILDNYENITLINRFIEDVEMCLEELKKESVSKTILAIIKLIEKEFQRLRKLPMNNKTKLFWAEKTLTWANILQHRAKLA